MLLRVMLVPLRESLRDPEVKERERRDAAVPWRCEPREERPCREPTTLGTAEDAATAASRTESRRSASLRLRLMSPSRRRCARARLT